MDVNAGQRNIAWIQNNTTPQPVFVIYLKYWDQKGGIKN